MVHACQQATLYEALTVTIEHIHGVRPRTIADNSTVGTSYVFYALDAISAATDIIEVGAGGTSSDRVVMVAVRPEDATAWAESPSPAR